MREPGFCPASEASLDELPFEEEEEVVEGPAEAEEGVGRVDVVVAAAGRRCLDEVGAIVWAGVTWCKGASRRGCRSSGTGRVDRDQQGG